MCGRFTQQHTMREVAERFRAVRVEFEYSPRYNIAPSQSVLAIRGDRRPVDLKWGLVPKWSKDPAKGPRPINARAETLSEKPMFRSALKSRRCLIPADGFYEWRKDPGGKQPMFIRLRGGALFGFAGLWEQWVDPESGEVLETCTVVTTKPNELMAGIHDRMPVILSPEAEDQWLDSGGSEDALKSLLVPYPAEKMEAYAVGRYVNSPAHDGPKCLEPEQDLGLF